MDPLRQYARFFNGQIKWDGAVMFVLLGPISLVYWLLSLQEAFKASEFAAGLLAQQGGYRALTGLVLAVLVYRLFRLAAQDRLFTFESRLCLVLTARIALLFALVISPACLMLLHWRFEQVLSVQTYLSGIDFPLITLAILLHLLAGLQKRSGEFKDEQDLTV
ncbi:DUF2975 domain-containing protein [Ferrimonas pelagia]|uniref:DUF2975 domain-containing protein n=1 Tax=Ferrimonas pelagia TaxID=1177826 RepID=A0ABP9F5L3_9GAMM